jgi:signal transduction histidine kinase
LLAIIAFAVPLAFSLRDRQDEEVRLQSRGQADVVAATAADLLAASQRRQLGSLATTAATSVRGRVAIVNRAGTLVADSAGADELGASYSARPEVAAALRGRRYQQTRHSNTLGEDLLATATPIFRGRRVVGVVRITQSVAALHRAVRRSVLGLVLIAAVVLLMGLTAGWLIARQLARPLRRLQTTAEEIAHGELDRRASVDGTSEQRSLARSFNEMTDRLATALRAQREFVADASHQLRTPLTGLKLRLEAAEVTADAAVREQVAAAHAEVDRLSHVVDELLLLSSAGGRDAPAEKVRLAEAAEGARARWQAAAEDRGIALTSATRGRPDAVTAARADVDRALDVIVANAIAYSGAGSVVRIEATEHRLEVIDAGPGLAPGEEEQVFERFHRGRAGRAGTPGTGLGLPIARELMRRWNAQVGLTNRRGGGTVAMIDFEPVDRIGER